MANELRFAHLSDLHFASRPRLRQIGPRRLLGWLNWLCFRRRCHCRQAIEAAVRSLVAAPPHAAFLTGDLVQLGLPQELETVAQALQPLSDAGIPVFVVRGNHDVYDNDPDAAAAWEKMSRAMRLGHEPDETGIVRFGEVEIMLLEQTIPASRFLSWGEMGEEARQRLGRRLTSPPPLLGRLALGHYPLSLPNGRRLPWGYRLRDDRQVENLLRAAKCAVYCCGHVHQPYARRLNTVAWQCCAGSFTAGGKIYRLALTPEGAVRWEE
ncbi:MAG: metallophosphoesterase [Planctomycetota bacterium]|nr:metallophosphoesterase [Planctomycetota bacterium]